MQEIREWRNGLLLLAGCIAKGRLVLAAEVLAADYAAARAEMGMPA